MVINDSIDLPSGDDDEVTLWCSYVANGVKFASFIWVHLFYHMAWRCDISNRNTYLWKEAILEGTLEVGSLQKLIKYNNLE